MSNRKKPTNAAQVAHMDQVLAATRDTAHHVTAQARRRGHQLDEVAIDGFVGLDATNDDVDPHTRLAIRTYLDSLQPGQNPRTCAHLRNDGPRQDWWSTAIPTTRFCGRFGCDQASVYVLLRRRGLLPARCLACGIQRVDAVVRLRVACGTTELVVHLCPTCDSEQSQTPPETP